MKEKLKKFFNKDRIFVFICLLCIIVFCVLYAILYSNDKNQVSQNESTIILNEDENNLNINSFMLSDNGSYVYEFSSEHINTPSGVIYDNFSVLGKAFVDDELTFSDYDLNYEFYCLDIDDMVSNDILTLTFYIVLAEDDTYIDFTPIDSFNFVPNIAFYFSNDPSQDFNFNNSSLLFDYDVVISSINDLYNVSFTYCFNIEEFKNLNYRYFNIAYYVSESLNYNNTYSSLMLYPRFNCEYHYNFTPVSGDDEELRQQYNTLLSQYNILNSQYSSLNSQFNTLNSQYTNLLSQYNSLNNSNIALQSQYDSLVASKNALQSQYDSLFASYSSLSSSNTDLQNDMQDLLDEYNSIQVNYDILESNYNTLLNQYNNLTTDKYTFTELFWSISAVPFGVLTSGFNVNVLGFNLAAIITGLFTSLLLIWLIKKFFK